MNKKKYHFIPYGTSNPNYDVQLQTDEAVFDGDAGGYWAPERTTPVASKAQSVFGIVALAAGMYLFHKWLESAYPNPHKAL